jgi:NADPH:quinone reductase-like Zn-dependent oxidoreductase
VGAGAGEFEVGDRVCGSVEHGALAEWLALPAEDLTIAPRGVDLDVTAAIITTYSTSLHAL